MVKRLFTVILIVLGMGIWMIWLLPAVVISVVFYPVRWIITGKEIDEPDYLIMNPLCWYFDLIDAE